MELNAFLYLLLDALFGIAIGGVESFIAAKSAATCADFAVTIGTAETRVDADFLHASAELLRKVVVVTVETPIIAPREKHGLFFCHKTHKTIKTFCCVWRLRNRVAAGKQPVSVLSFAKTRCVFCKFCMFCDNYLFGLV
jgi:hypothetical protein